MSRFIVSYNKLSEFYIICIYAICSASFMFANAVVDSCSTCIRKSIFSLMSRLDTSTNVIVYIIIIIVIVYSDVCIERIDLPLRDY